MKKTDKLTFGASFFNETIEATSEQLWELFGEPSFNDNTGSDKVNLEWVLEDEEGNIITIYDWKEYRRIFDDEIIGWHIGGKEKLHTIKAKMKLEELLNQK